MLFVAEMVEGAVWLSEALWDQCWAHTGYLVQACWMESNVARNIFMGLGQHPCTASPGAQGCLCGRWRQQEPEWGQETRNQNKARDKPIKTLGKKRDSMLVLYLLRWFSSNMLQNATNSAHTPKHSCLRSSLHIYCCGGWIKCWVTVFCWHEHCHVKLLSL